MDDKIVEDSGWNRQQTLILIRELKNYPCSYNPLDANYINKIVRSAKLNSILIELKKWKPNVTITAIKNKIRSLKSQLWKENQKIQNSKRSGSGADEIYESKLWCYKEMFFLSNVNDAEPSKSSIDLSDIGIDELNEYQENLESSKIITPRKTKSKIDCLEAQGMEAINFMKTYFEKKRLLRNHCRKRKNFAAICAAS